MQENPASEEADYSCHASRLAGVTYENCCISPVRSSSTGFSLCGFDFHARRTPHRLKPVLPKPASHRNAIRRLIRMFENKYLSRDCEKFGLRLQVHPAQQFLEPRV